MSRRREACFEKRHAFLVLLPAIASLQGEYDQEDGMSSTLRTTARPFEDFRVRHESELAALYKRTRAASWKITEEQWAAAIYKEAISGASQATAADQELAIRPYLVCLHTPALPFPLSSRPR